MAVARTITLLFRARTNVFLLSFFFVGWYALFIGIPVLIIPWNSLTFQLSIFTPRDYILMGVLAMLTSLFAVIQIELFRRHRRHQRYRRIGVGGAGGAVGVLAAILGTAACTQCVAVILGFLGFGTVLTIVRFRWYVVVLAIAFMITSIILTLRHLEKPCERCVR